MRAARPRMRAARPRMRSILDSVSTANIAENPALSTDYGVLTRGCGVIDNSERGKLALTGPGAVEFLNGQVTNELASLRPGEGCYAAFLTHKGKMLGDLRILATGEPGGVVCGLLLDTERVTLQGLFDMIRRFRVGHDFELQKRTLQSSLLSLRGPEAASVAMRALDHHPTGEAGGAGPAGAALADSVHADCALADCALADAEHAHRRASIAGRPVRLIRTAGPPGVDVLCETAHAQGVHDTLLSAGAQPVSEAAGEIVRVEHGRPRYGVDLDDTVIPQEAGLNERAVSFTKGCYVGQETVARLHYRGKPNRHLRGLRLSSSVPSGEELRLGDRTVGRVGTAVVSPELGPIGLALVRREAEPGAVLSVGDNGATGEIVPVPFRA